jgi:nicotinic acid mononucleotide adenylyltransferase
MPIKLLTAELDDERKRPTQEIINDLDSLPSIELVHLIGSDGYIKLKADGRIHSDINYLVRNRPGYERIANQSENVRIFDGPTLEISSTQIREMIKNHDDTYKNFLPEPIAAFVEEHELYSR